MVLLYCHIKSHKKSRPRSETKETFAVGCRKASNFSFVLQQRRHLLSRKTFDKMKWHWKPSFTIYKRADSISPPGDNRNHSSKARDIAKQRGVPQKKFKATRGWRLMNQYRFCLWRRTSVCQKLLAGFEEKLIEFHSFVIKKREGEGYHPGQIANAGQTRMYFDMPTGYTVNGNRVEVVKVRTVVLLHRWQQTPTMHSLQMQDNSFARVFSA